jgi:hypothetical protein
MIPLMRTPLFVCALVLAGSATTAHAQPDIYGGARGPGLGVEQNLGGLTGLAFSYDAGRFHINVLTHLAHFNEDGPDLTFFGIGGRFFFRLHEMAGSDFSLGGGVAILQTEFGDFSDTAIHLEGAAQIRIFVVPNVSLMASLGLVILTAGDAEVTGGPIAGGRQAESIYAIGGQLTGSFGVIYYFR